MARTEEQKLLIRLARRLNAIAVLAAQQGIVYRGQLLHNTLEPIADALASSAGYDVVSQQ
jgi:hypothetical protein